MCKLLLQAAILAIHLPFICGEGWIKNDTEAADQGGGGDWGTVNDMPAGFTIECTYENQSTACEGSSCRWNGFNSCDKKVMNNEQFLCQKYKGQYSCVVANSINEEDPFCNSSTQCGFQDGFQNGTCAITKKTETGTDNGCSTNSPQGSGASIDMPAGFTIKCTDESIKCKGSSCGWNGFNSSNEKVINNEQFSCQIYKATGQYSCNVDNNINDEEAFCTSNKECGFEKVFQKGICTITKKTGPGTDKDSVTNSAHDRIIHPDEPRPTNSGACTGKSTIIYIVVGVLAISALNQMEAKTVETSPFPSNNNRHAQQMILLQNQEIKG